MRSLLFSTLICALLWQTGCKPITQTARQTPDFPAAEGKEWCVNGKCQACRPGEMTAAPAKPAITVAAESVPAGAASTATVHRACAAKPLRRLQNDSGCQPADAATPQVRTRHPQTMQNQR